MKYNISQMQRKSEIFQNTIFKPITLGDTSAVLLPMEVTSQLVAGYSVFIVTRYK